LRRIKDARNFVTACTFDGHDRPLRTTYQDSTYEEISSYDGNSNPLTLRTRSAATVTLTYDELNRIKTKSPTGQAVVTTVYDIAGRVSTVSTPVAAGDPSSGTFTNFYDTAGRFYKEQYPDGLSVTRLLDANSNVTKITYPDGYFVDRVYDELNRLTDIKLNGAGSSAAQFQYDALSRRTKLVYENGCTTNYTFEVDNDLSSLLHNFVGSNVQFNFSFDNANQMATHRVSDPANFRWTPPAPATTSYGTATNINQYPTVGGTAQTYSTDGCLTNDGTFKYEFNTERMMIRVRNAGTNAIIADYFYDPALRQRQKKLGSVKTNYYYSAFQRLADYDGSAGTPGTLLNRYVYGAGLDEVLIQVTAGGTKSYYHQNHQNSVIATTSSSGAVLNRYTYGPFGESAVLTGTTYGYTGQRYDAETELYYYKMRQYSPKLGRFLQPDPIGLAGGLNLYAYVGNSPLQASDPMGLAADGGGSSASLQFGPNDAFAVGKYGFGWYGGTPPDTSGWIEQHWYGGTDAGGWNFGHNTFYILVANNAGSGVGVTPPFPSKLVWTPQGSSYTGWRPGDPPTVTIGNNWQVSVNYTNNVAQYFNAWMGSPAIKPIFIDRNGNSDKAFNYAFGNAARHMLGAGNLVFMGIPPEYAQTIMLTHEIAYTQPPFIDVSNVDTAIDIFNNKIGAELAAEVKARGGTFDEFAQMVIERAYVGAKNSVGLGLPF